MAAPKLHSDRGWMGDPKRGASHGRAERARNPLRDPWLDTKRLYLRRLHLDSGGYDEGGAYWGHGEPLYGRHRAEPSRAAPSTTGFIPASQASASLQ
jgi:hypothetical protein